MRGRLDRLVGDQRGFMLIELLTTILIGIVVLGAAMTLLEVGARSAGRATDRADVTQRGRTAMNLITRRLRSQVCVDSKTPPIYYGDPSSVTYYTDSDDDVYFAPQKHQVWLDPTWKGGRGAIRESVFTPDQTSSQGPPWTYNQAPRGKVLLEDVTTVSTTPFLRYYGFDASTALATPLSAVTTGDPLPANSVAKVVRVDVSYRALPSRASSSSGRPTGTGADPARDSDFESSVWVRNSDYTDLSAADTDRAWGPRCA